MSKIKDLSGLVFNRLTVTAIASARSTQGGMRWKCLCSCGNKTTIAGTCLQSGNTQSCGCLKEVAIVTHGMCGTPTYHSWATMQQRCVNKNNTGYKNYGARGIKVCERWIGSFERFYADMGKRPSTKHTIDRIDNDGDYTPDNCRWATKNEQVRNIRSNVLITHEGTTLCATDWSSRTGIHINTIRYRFHAGWPSDEILTTKPYAIRHANKLMVK